MDRRQTEKYGIPCLIPLKTHLCVQPDLQYISRPGGIAAYKGAWIFGVRAIMEF